VTNGVRPLSFTLLSGGLPPGLFLESDGVVSGETTSLVSTTAIVQATDLLGRSTTRSVNVAITSSELIVPPPKVTNVLCASPTAVTFDLLVVAGASYTVERSVDCLTWTTFLTTNAATDLFSLRVPIDAACAFFRVRCPGALAPPAPHPLTVTPTRSTNTFVTAQLDEFGGAIHLTNTAGYVFALNVPAGALDRPETITMTDINQLGGLPLSGGLLAAVDLQPEGVVFSTPVRLDIVAPANLNATNAIGFNARNDGSQLALQPTFNTNRTVSLYLWHFSLAGAGQGTASDAQAQVQNAPDDPMSAYTQQTAATLQACRADPNCDVQSISGELCVTYRNMADNVVLPKLKAAVTDDSAIDDALGTWLRWLREAELLGLQDGGLSAGAAANDCLGNRAARAANLAATALHNAINKACQRCMNHEIWEIYHMGKLVRTAELLGFSEDSESFFQCARKCLVFELSIESEIVGSNGQYILSTHTKGKAKLRAIEDDDLLRLKLLFTGSGQWPVTAHQEPDIHASGCSWQISPAPGRLQFPLVSIQLYRERMTYVPGQGEVTIYTLDPNMTVYMSYNLSLMPKENRVVVCPGVPPPPDINTFDATFCALHNQEGIIPTGIQADLLGGPVFRFTGFSGPGPEDVILTKTYFQSGGGVVTENTLIELRHTPGR
jgi:hypothetical protein